MSDDASWPAIVRMLNEFLLDYRWENQRLRNELIAKDRAIEMYRKLIADFWVEPTSARETIGDERLNQSPRDRPKAQCDERVSNG